jgi:hypothetical protein
MRSEDSFQAGQHERIERGTQCGGLADVGHAVSVKNGVAEEYVGRSVATRTEWAFGT